MVEGVLDLEINAADNKFCKFQPQPDRYLFVACIEPEQILSTSTSCLSVVVVVDGRNRDEIRQAWEMTKQLPSSQR